MQKSGFTLLEGSIVLVIIAVLVGGLMVGKDIVKGAELRHTLAQIDNYNNDIATFVAKYNCLPGDCVNAVAHGLKSFSGNLCLDGDGDGIINTHNFHTAQNNTNAREKYNLWCHLAQAHLLEGNFPGVASSGAQATSIAGLVPAAPYGTYTHIMAVTLGDPTNPVLNPPFGNAFVLFADTQLSGLTAANYPNNALGGGMGGDWPAMALTGTEGFMLDSKIDDGLPLSGKVRSLNIKGGGASGFVYDTASQFCTDANSHYYTLYQGGIPLSTPVCVLALHASW